MSHRKVLAFLLVLSIALVPIVPPPARAAGAGFNERLTAYVAGSDAAWFLGFGNVNVSNSHVASAESGSGVNWYNLTAIRTTSWVSDFQIFGPQGYRVLPVPFVPREGVFLTVGAAGYSDAAGAAAQFGAYLLTAFESTSNSSGAFSFFAPVSFNSIIPSTLLRLLPSGLGGFARAIAPAGFIALQSPMVTLGGQRGGSGFIHTLVLGSITSSGLDSSSRPNLLKYFGSTVSSIQSSNRSSSSSVAFHFLDGVVVSSDNASLTKDTASFTSSYELKLSPGAKLYRLNATLVQQPAELLATRQVDVGVLRTGSNMSVTISLTNLSNSTSLSRISVNDNWWQGTGLFKLVRGSSNVTIATLGAGQSSNPTYVLQFTDKATQQLSIPQSPVSYSYLVGGSVFSEHAILNGITISLGADEPAVFAYLSPSGGLRHSAGDNQSLKVFVKNVGTRTASTVVVAGQQVGGLAPDGGSTTVGITASAPSLVRANVTRSYEVSYATPEGQTVSLKTNALPVIFSHTSMKVGFGVLKMSSNVTGLPGGAGSRLNISLDFANQGSAAVGSLSARYPLPAGLSCGSVGGTNITCGNGVVSLFYSRVLPQGQEHSWISFNVAQQRSFIFWPVTFSLSTSGYNLTGASNAQPVGTGLALSKQFNPSQLFPGIASQVTVTASNGGPYAIYNASFATTADSFDQVSGTAATSKSVDNLTAGANLTFSFGVSTGSASVSTSSAPIAASYFLGGTPFTVSQAGPRVSVYQLPSATITTTPQSPTEGKDFTIRVLISNPAPVGITNVQFLLPIPPGVTLGHPVNATVSAGGLIINLGQMAGSSTYAALVNASANSGQTIPFAGAKLTFGYAGASMKGRLPSAGIAIGENVVVRYELPMALVLLALLATAFYVRRMAGATSQASQK